MSRPVVCLFLLGAAAAADSPKEWTPELQMKVRNVGSVTPSPDGTKVVWTQTWAVMEEEKSEYVTHIFLARIDGRDRVQLTRGEKSADSPRWSADGDSVYFASERDGKPKIYRIPVSGGEAELVTGFRGKLGQWDLSPDGKWIALTGGIPEPGEEKARKEKLDVRVVDETPVLNSLWIVSSDPEPACKNPPRELVKKGYHVGAFDWSPDGRRIAYEHRPRADANVARAADISEVDVESGAITVLAGSPFTETQARYSPDGRYVAFLRSAGRPGALSGNRIVVLTRGSKPPEAARELPATFDENPSLLDWTADSRNLLFAEGRRTRNALYLMPLDAPLKALYAPGRGVAQPGAMNKQRTHMGVVLQNPSEPPEAFVLALASGTPVQVSEANGRLPKPPLGETRVVSWKARDGLDIEGLLTLPAGYQESKRVPLIVNIHGGPAGVFGEGFIAGPAIYPVASFAAKGYAVLRPNPRGSSSYGLPFRKSVFQDWGGADYLDIMTGVDLVVRMGVADPDRLAVMGWSYGGYMTSWIVTQTGRFKAAAIGAGITNNISMYGTQDIPSVFEDYFGGPPWEQLKVYLDRSPMFHVGKVKTPVLILHGERDERVPPGQAFEFYNALKRQGVETKLVVYPRTPHGPREPKFVLDIAQRHIDWVEKHLK